MNGKNAIDAEVRSAVGVSPNTLGCNAGRILTVATANQRGDGIRALGRNSIGVDIREHRSGYLATSWSDLATSEVDEHACVSGDSNSPEHRLRPISRSPPSRRPCAIVVD